jgi:hypothetical protein
MPRNVRLMWTKCMAITAPCLDLVILGSSLNIAVVFLAISVVTFR